MFNTYDVHFNASWMMIQLWPRIELAMLYDLIDMTASEDTTAVTFIYKNQKGPRNARLGVPHDCGDPEREPWYNVNAYIMYPTDNWKDLSPKFILMAWRDWRLTRNTSFLQYALPVVIVSWAQMTVLWTEPINRLTVTVTFTEVNRRRDY